MEKSPARHNQEERYALANTTTVFDFAKRYVTEIVEKNCKDTRHIRRYLDNEIYPRLAEKAIKDVSAADVQDIVFRKRDEGAPLRPPRSATCSRGCLNMRLRTV